MSRIWNSPDPTVDSDEQLIRDLSKVETFEERAQVLADLDEEEKQ